MVLFRPVPPLASLSPRVSAGSRLACRAYSSLAPRPAHSLAAASTSASASWSGRSGGPARPGLGWSPATPAAARGLQSSMMRGLTTAAREKVKVLLVLYDGGQHAKDVSSFFLRFLSFGCGVNYA